MDDTISYEDAVAMLPEGEYIHTFRGGSGLMIGCDWSRESILKAIEDTSMRRPSGRVAASMNHRLAIVEGESWLFIETAKAS